MSTRVVARVRRTPILLLLLVISGISVLASTVTLNESVLVNDSPMKIGVTVSTATSYDSGQLFKNLLYTVNPGFEGFIQQEIVGCLSGSATDCVNFYQWDQAPANYWAGATAYFCCSARSSNANFGLTRTIASSSTASGSVGPTYTFNAPLPQPLAADDYFSVVRQVDVTGTAGVPGWTLSGGAAGDNSRLPPGSPGLQVLALPSGACATNYADHTGTHDFVILEQRQTFSFSLKTLAAAGSPTLTVSITRVGDARGGVSPSSATLTPSGAWTTQSASFAGTETTGLTYGALQVRICSSGGTALVDDADFERTSRLDTDNTSVYRDEVVASLRAMNPGSLRLWAYHLGETLADWTNPLYGRHVQSSLAGQTYVTAGTGRNAGSTAQGLMDFLGLCEVLGAKPWITIPLSWPASDYSKLVDFLAGGADTVYGAKRIAQGHPATYLSTLGNVYIEFGNEPWNTVFAGINMPNFTYASTTNGMLSYGYWSRTAMSAMRANRNYSSQLRLIVNMQAASTHEYTTHVLPNNPYIDAVAIAPYIGDGQLNNVGSLAAEWNPDAAFAFGDSNDTRGTSGNGQTYAYAKAASLPVYVYEDNLNHVDGTAPASMLQNHNSSFMGGTIVGQQMLEHLKVVGPNAPQHIWSLAQDYFTNNSSTNVPLYGIMKEAGGQSTGTGNYIQRPVALAVQLINDSIIGPEYGSSITNAATFSTPASNGIASASAVPYEFAYCFADGSDRSCVLVNTDPVNGHTFTLTGANVPTSVRTRTLSMGGGTIDTCNNESANPCVGIITVDNVALAGGAVTVAPGTIKAIDFTTGPSSTSAISAVKAVSISSTSAVITWTTSLPSSSQVQFSAAGKSVSSPLVSSLVTAHAVTLTGLTPATAYSYSVASTAPGWSATLPGGVFTTTATSLSTTIAAIGGAYGHTGTSSSPTSLTIPYKSGTGNTIVAVCALGSAASSISEIRDSGSFWSFRAGVNNGTAVRTEIWSTNAGGSIASTSVAISINHGTPASCALEEYTGVSSLGNSATNAATSGTMSAGLTTQDANNFIVAGLGANSYYGYTLTNGTMRQAGGLTQNSGANYTEIVLCDNTSALSSSVSCSSASGPAPWAISVLELRSGGTSGPILSAISATGISPSSATITWTTDQPSGSQVAYGTTSSYGSLSPASAALVTSHSVILSGLTPSTSYNYSVLSGGVTSSNLTFSTPAAPAVPSGPSASAIAPIGGAHNNTGPSAAPTSLTIPYTSRTGSTLVAVCALGGTSASISAIRDSGSAWTFRAGANNGSAVRTEVWSTTAGGSVASTVFTIAIAGAAPASCALEEYEGVATLGNTATSSGSSGTMSVGLVTQDPNNFIVAGLGANSYYGYTLTNGTQRQSGGLTQNTGNNYVEVVLCDNAVALSGSATCSSVSGPAPWAIPALELRSR